jgi:hypothetical protein
MSGMHAASWQQKLAADLPLFDSLFEFPYNIIHTNIFEK